MDIRSLTATALLALTPGGLALAQAETDQTTPGDEPATEVSEEPAFRLPPVVVTARKIEELTQDVPLSVTVVPESTIEDAGLRSIQDAARLVPNLNMVEFTARRLSFPFIRGIGSGQGDPAVTTYVDGVPQLSVSSTNLRFLDVQRLEFLRGPQGTLYGRNAIGGVIHVITRRPDDHRLEASATFGDYDLREYTLSLAMPLVEDQLHLGLSGLMLERDGYTRNDFSGNDVDDRDTLFGRADLLWTPDDRNELRLQLYGEDTRDGGFVLSDLATLRDRPHRINQDFEGRTDRDILSSSLTWTHAGDAIDVTAITAFVDWEITETTDFDFSVIDGIRRRTDESQDHLSQELRFASAKDAPIELADNATLKWQAGVLVFDADSTRSAANEFRPAGAGILFPPANVGVDRASGEFDDRAVGVFGEATLTLDDRLDLTAGLRYDYETKEADIVRTFTPPGFPPVTTSSVSEDEDFDELIPRFSAAYRWCDAVMTYATAARGWKAGGFNLTSPMGQTTFDTETSWTYEAGIKTTWLDDRLSLNAAAFYIDWDDMQLSQFDPATGGYVTNAGNSTSTGFELEWGVRPAEGLELFGGFGYLETEFDRFTDSFGADVSGNELPFAPETTLNVGAQYRTPIGGDRTLFVRGEYTNLGTFYYDAGNLEGEQYELADFRVGVEGHSWRVEAWIRNAFDEEYVPVAIQPNPFDPTAFVGRNGPPQTVGVTVSLRF